MASLRLLLVFLGLTGLAVSQRPSRKEWEEKQENATKAAEAKAARQAKMAAVQKVITLLEDLRTQVTDEGESEAKTYNKFACFCKDTTKEKTDEIKKGEDDKASLSANIEKLTKKRDGLDDEITKLTDSIDKAEKKMKEKKEERAKTKAEYDVNAADLSAALSALEGAIKVLKNSENPSFVQLRDVANTVRTAAMLADALGFAVQSPAMASFLQQAPVPFENYKFHSGDIIASLEKLLDDFRKEKAEVDAEEVKSVAEYEAFVQLYTDKLKNLNVELKAAKKEREETIANIGSDSEELTTVSAELLDDQQYLMELAKMCSEKAQTYDQRQQVRQDELSALTAAIGIVTDSVKEQTSAATIRFAQKGVSVRIAEAIADNEDAMEAVEAEAEEADAPASFFQRQLRRHPQGFLQRSSAPTNDKDGREFVMSMLRSKGTQLHSTLLTSLAAQIAADPFAKVKVLIQELIERLLQEAANEANQKGWCDKATADAEQKRDYAVAEIRDLNGRMAELDARNDTLTEELQILSDEIAELKDKQAAAEKIRSEEKAENEYTIQEAEAGLKAVNQAIDVLDKFYKTAAKEEVKYSLAQGPADDAPDAGFKSGEAYTGAQGEATGIIGMLEVIQSDFVRTITETKKAEEQAEQEHMEFMTKTGMSLAEKDEVEKEKTRQRDEAMEKHEKASDDLDSETEVLKTSLKELMELKPACVDTGMSYEERVARREDEIQALNKALCILQRYAEFGPDGLADAC